MEHIALKEKCLDKAINKFDDLTVIMQASRQFYSFLFSAGNKSLDATNDEEFEGGDSHDGDMVEESLGEFLEQKTEFLEREKQKELLKFCDEQSDLCRDRPRHPEAIVNETKVSRPLTTLQMDILKAIIDIKSTGTRPMCTGLAKRIEKSFASIKYAVKAMELKGYVRLEYQSKSRFWIVLLKNEHGEDLMPSNVVIEDGVRVTKCPPAYAEGYGFGEIVSPKNYV